MLGFYGWDADFSQSIHELGLFHGWDVRFGYSVHKMLGFCGWDADFSQSIHKIGLFHGWVAENELHPTDKFQFVQRKLANFRHARKLSLHTLKSK